MAVPSGVVTDAPNFGAGDLIEVKPAQGAPFYLPFTRAVVPEIDLSARRMRVEPDEDLLPEAFQRQSGDGDTN